MKQAFNQADQADQDFAGRRLRRCAFLAALPVFFLAGCSSLPMDDVQIVDRSVSTGGQPAPVTDFGSLRDSGRTHTVAPGDTIYNISVRYGVKPNELMQLNAVTDPTQLAIGRVLHIPVSTTEPRELTVPAGVRVTRLDASADQDPSYQVAPSEAPAAPRASQTPAAQPAQAAQQTAQNTAQAAAPAAVIPGTRMLWPVRGQVLSNYAQNKMGLDISSPEGSVVVAAGAGTVLYVGTVTNYGNLVIVKHTPTVVTAYGHCSKITAKAGEQVKAGQKIAESGKNEKQQPVLRFEVRDKGQPVDPMKYLPAQNR